MRRNLINISLTVFFSVLITFLIYKQIIYPTIIPMISNGLLYLFADWSVIINANICLKDGLDVYIENSCDPWGRKHVYGKILLNFPFIDKFKKIYFYYIPIVMNFLFIFMTVNFFNNYKSNKKYFILFFLFSAPFLLAIERANTDVLIFLILYLLCKYKNTIQNYFLVLLSFATKIYPICFGILFFFKKGIKEILVSVALLFFFVSIFFFFQSEIFFKIINNQAQFSGSGIYQFSFKGLIQSIKGIVIYNSGVELKIIKNFLIFIVIVLPVFFITNYFLKSKNNNVFLTEIFKTNNFENRIYVTSSTTLIVCYFLIQNFFYREIFFLGLVPWILSNDYRKDGFINFLFYLILLKFIFSTFFITFVMNKWYENLNFLVTFLKHLMDFYLLSIILIFLIYNLIQYFKNLKNRSKAIVIN